MSATATTFELIPAGQAHLQTPDGPVRVLPIPWRDPHTVEPEQLQQYISMLERACVEHPHNADFRTCLGMAHPWTRSRKRAASSRTTFSRR